MSRKNWLTWMVVMMSSVVLSGCGKSTHSNVTDEPDNQTTISSETPDVTVAFGTSDASDESMMPDDFTIQTPIENHHRKMSLMYIFQKKSL